LRCLLADRPDAVAVLARIFVPGTERLLSTMARPDHPAISQASPDELPGIDIQSLEWGWDTPRQLQGSATSSQPDQPRLSPFVIRSARPTLAEVPLAEVSLAVWPTYPWLL
jgi:hypothetical protein